MRNAGNSVPKVKGKISALLCRSSMQPLHTVCGSGWFAVVYVPFLFNSGEISLLNISELCSISSLIK